MPRLRPFSNLSTKRRIKLVVAYDGGGYKGWASQKGQKTVHGTLTEAVRQISGEESEIFGASRTDSGASARGQVCHFDVTAPIPVEKWPLILNKILPNDISVVSAEEVDEDFNSRFCALHRWYRYRILVGPKDPFRARQAFHYGRELDIEAMQEAVVFLRGEHNFLAFSQELPRGANPVRLIKKASVNQVADEIRIDITGTAFVRGMMRRISGSLWEVGRGVRAINSVQRLLDPVAMKKETWPTVLPACGLTLMKISYGRHPRDWRVDLINGQNELEKESDE